METKASSIAVATTGLADSFLGQNKLDEAVKLNNDSI